MKCSAFEIGIAEHMTDEEINLRRVDRTSEVDTCINNLVSHGHNISNHLGAFYVWSHFEANTGKNS